MKRVTLLACQMFQKTELLQSVFSERRKRPEFLRLLSANSLYGKRCSEPTRGDLRRVRSWARSQF